MAKLSKDLSSGNLHPRENLLATGNLGAANAEVIVSCDGCSMFSLDMRGTFNLTVEVSGTIDGTNWQLIPVRSQTGGIYVASLANPGAGIWRGECAGYRQIRARCTAYTSGLAVATLLASTSVAPLETALQGAMMSLLGTQLGTSGAAATLTLAAPGAGLRHYLSFIRITRFATAALTAAATPVAVTTTNLPGSLAFTLPADGLTLGAVSEHLYDFNRPVISTAQNTATTVVCPATTAVIWRIIAGGYVSP